MIAGAGLAMIRMQAVTVEGGANQFAANRSLAWRAPLGTGLFVFGCLSLVGLPLTPGFAGSWPAVVLISQQATWLAVILTVAIAAGAFGVLRRMIPLLQQPDQVLDEDSSPEGRAERIVAVIILTLGALLVFFPQIVLSVAESMAKLF
jgi:NADH:ubiquinone oxidoreductase subunit 2 (subunit N)